MRIHIVKTGESLSIISEMYFGDWSMTDAIAKLNELTNKDVIYPGQSLLIPNKKEEAAQVTYEPTAKEKAINNGIKIAMYSILGLAAVAIGVKIYKDSKKEKKSA